MIKRITLMLFLLLSMTAGYTPTVQADTLLVWMSRVNALLMLLITLFPIHHKRITGKP